MKSAPEPSTQEVLTGLVERVTFHNAENGFCVLRAKARGHRDLVTVVGHAAIISAGEWITASGEWINDRTHGQQFKARFLKTSAPSSIDGIEKYLGSGMIRGIGPVYAKKMVKAFGEKVFDIIEAEPNRLREVTRIGTVRAKRITDAWAAQKIVREIMVFLHSNGVGTARAVRIYKTYGADAVQVMTENPYRLARDIRGIGFKTADAIAMKLGVEKTAMIRLRAGISYALTEAMDEGHCGLPTEQLIPLAEELLEAPKELILTALELEQSEGAVIADKVGETACTFLAGLYRAEQTIADRLVRIINGKLPWTWHSAERLAAQSPARKPGFNVNLPKYLTVQVMPSGVAPMKMRALAPTKSSNTHRAPHAARGFIPRRLSYACRRPKLFTRADRRLRAIEVSQRAFAPRQRRGGSRPRPRANLTSERNTHASSRSNCATSTGLLNRKPW
jgi:exodeoxyribonuclease V alpha subunit